MGFLTLHQLSFIFGLLGNIVSVGIFLAPVPTFYDIYKKKSSEGYQSIPYIIALSSAMLLLYYGILKSNAYLLISINTIGCVLEITYLIFYLIYASKLQKGFTLKLILVLNIGAFGAIMLIINLLLKGSKRVTVFGWICAVYSVAVFAAPLGIMKQVITTKSVEFMPLSLSFALTLGAIVWFFYGFCLKDFFVAGPNILGFVFGVAQMVLYFIYRDTTKNTKANTKQQRESTENQADREDIC